MTETTKSQRCTIKLLDGEEIFENLNVSTTYGVTLFDKVCSYLKLSEKDYFSLKYIHPKDKLYTWLNLRKTLKKQLKEGPYTFYFLVKFYPPDPCTLQEDLTRYLFVLAIRDLIFTGMISCSINCQLKLSSHILQAEFGDWTAELSAKNYLTGLRFIQNQTEEFEKKLENYHKKNKGLTPEEVEVQFLKIAKELDLYGVELHDVRDQSNLNFIFGISFKGLNLFEDSRELYTVFWPELISVTFFKKSISIKLLMTTGASKIVTYKCATRASTKRLYRSIVEFHTFFRRPLPLPPISGISLSSKFRYNGRKTYLQLQNNITSSKKIIDDTEMYNHKETEIYDEEEVYENGFENGIKNSKVVEVEEQFDDSDEKEEEIEVVEKHSKMVEYETQVFEAKFDSNGRMIPGSKVQYTEACNLGIYDNFNSKNFSSQSTSTYLI